VEKKISTKLAIASLQYRSRNQQQRQQQQQQNNNNDDNNDNINNNNNNHNNNKNNREVNKFMFTVYNQSTSSMGASAFGELNGGTSSSMSI